MFLFFSITSRFFLLDISKKYIKIFLWFLLIFLYSFSLLGQQVVSGVVRDGITEEPLIGVNVVIKDTDKGTVTDIEGRYEIEVFSNDDILVFSYVGYQHREVQVGSRSSLDVILGVGETLDEVVFIGYGEIKKKDVTGALQTVTSESFNKGALTSAQQLLSGKIAGVNISNSGNPGGGAVIRIRGESSLSASNDPLIVIDGIPLDNDGIHGGRNNLNIINPEDIASMTVLKDASATAIYGNRAAAGVILITTKKGRISDGFKLQLNTKLSIANKVGKIDVLSSEEFRDAINERYGTDSDAAMLLGEANTDWQQEIFEQAFAQDYMLSSSGGILGLPFRASVGYTDNKGILRTDRFQRTTGNLQFTPGFFNNRLQINMGVKFSRQKNRFADNGAIGSAIGFDPTQPIYSGVDDFGGYFAWRNPETGVLTGLAPANPVALLEQKEDISTLNRYILHASVDYRFGFLPDLRANLNLGYDISNSSGRINIDTTAAFASSYNFALGIDEGGVLNTYGQEKNNSLLEFYLNYKKELLGNDFDIMLGYSWQRFFNSSDFFNSNLIGTVTTEGRDAAELYMLSLFSRMNYSVSDLVYLTATLRQDYTSRFSPKNRKGLFPALGISFRLINNETHLFNNLKLRMGWGITGQQDIGGYYLYQGLYQRSNETAAYQLGNNFITTFRPNGYDSGIKWETTTTYNAGADISLIKNRLNASVDIYQKNTKDLLNYSVQVPVGSNLTNVVATNIGNMETKGLEFSVSSVPIQTKDFVWDIQVNTAYNKSIITKLNEDDTSIGEEVGGISGGVGNTIQIHTVGYEPYAFWVFEQKYDENGSLLPGEFVDRNGDGMVNAEDRYRIEASTPRWTGGLSSAIRFKKWDFSFAGRSYFGGKIYNNVQTDIGFTDRMFDLGVLKNIHSIALQNNIEQQSEATFSDAYVFDASFFRMDHITLGYIFDLKTLKEWYVYTTVQNPFVLTNYDGLDPEIFRGIDNNIYPRPRVFLIGANIKLR